MGERLKSITSGNSLALSLVLETDEKQQAAILADLGQPGAKKLLSDWKFWARPSQRPPDGSWFVWLILSGRGWGKTRTGAEWLSERAQATPNAEWAVLAPTFNIARTVCVEGDGALLSALRNRDLLKNYNRSTYEISLTNGGQIFIYGADDPQGIVGRGRNLSGAWCDELASWRYRAVWDEGLMPALRLNDPRVVVTTTPRPVKLIRELVARTDGSVHVTRGSTFENAANLAPAALAELQTRYGGTRIGRQELEGEILDDVPGALWTLAQIDGARVRELPEMVRIVVGVDPSVTSGEDSDETGIVIAGLGVDGEYYVLGDESIRLGFDRAAPTVVQAYRDYQADRVVAERNNGGDMVEHTLRQIDAAISFRSVVASRGKRVRAEPIAALYEQARVHHCGSFPKLEDQMLGFVADMDRGPGQSPDRVDALVWALTDLAEHHGPLAVTLLFASMERDW